MTVSHVKSDLGIHGTVSLLENGHLQLLDLQSLTSFMSTWIIIVISLLQDDDKTAQDEKEKVAKEIVSTCYV